MKNHTELLLATPSMFQSRDLLIHVLKLPLHEDGEFIPGKTTKVFRILTTDQNQDVLVLDQENVPDGIYRIQNNKISEPISNYWTELKPKTPELSMNKY